MSEQRFAWEQDAQEDWDSCAACGAADTDGSHHRCECGRGFCHEHDTSEHILPQEPDQAFDPICIECVGDSDWMEYETLR